MAFLAGLNRAQLIIYGIIGLVVLLALILIVGGRDAGPGSAEIIVWAAPHRGIERDPLLGIVDEYETKNPGTNITLVEKDPTNYESELINALASNQGPDIFFLDDSQILRHQDKISPFPSNELLYAPDSFRTDFADMFHSQLITPEGKIIGFPLYLDTLALFYNKDFFNSANIPAPAATWDAFAEQVKALTIIGADNELKRAGVALGLANVDHYTDIVSLLIMQAGDGVYDRAARKVEIDRAAAPLEFYASFAIPGKKNYSWSLAYQNSFEAFADEKVAMMLWYASDIRRRSSQNPHLNFGTAPVPQIKEGARRVTLGRYQFAAVSRLSLYPSAAWNFVLYLTGPSVKRYLDVNKLPPARRLLISFSSDRLVAPFYGQVLSAKNWLKPDTKTADDIFKEMIEAVTARRFDAAQTVPIARHRLNTAYSAFK